MKKIDLFFKWFLFKLTNRFYIYQWQILFSFDRNHIDKNDFKNFYKIVPPKDRFWADPFFIENDGRFFIFFEEMLFSEDKGKISCVEVFKDGTHSNPKLVISGDYHFSYPFILKINNKFLMIPETLENHTIQIYECNIFPYNWRLNKTIFKNISAVDPTVFFYQNKYWLFANLKSKKTGSTWDELNLFFTDNLFNDSWKSHPSNPIVNDIRFSRPAGNIFINKNKIFRPSQNCSKHYGHSITIREIIKLNEYEYEEITYNSFLPDWNKNVISIHTINKSDNFCVIDAKYKRSRFI